MGFVRFDWNWKLAVLSVWIIGWKNKGSVISMKKKMLILSDGDLCDKQFNFAISNSIAFNNKLLSTSEIYVVFNFVLNVYQQRQFVTLWTTEVKGPTE
jgi:hypothetical protein